MVDNSRALEHLSLGPKGIAWLGVAVELSTGAAVGTGGSKVPHVDGLPVG